MTSEPTYGPGAVHGLTKPGHCGHDYKIGQCPICDPSAPEVRQNGDETIETHPAYAMIVANRVSSTGEYLYASDFSHQHFVTVSIHRSEMRRGLSHDWPYEREEYIEIEMSEAQWATFVSSLNSQKVPCTLARKDGKRISRLPKPPERTAQFATELKETLGDALKRLGELRARIVAGKGGRESLALLDKALQEIEQNAEYVGKLFGTHMETTVEKAKAEIVAYVTQIAGRVDPGKALESPITLALPEKGEPQ